MNQQSLSEFRKSFGHFENIMSCLNEALYIIDRDFTIVMVNKTLARWLERHFLQSDVIGKNLFEAYPFLPEKMKKEYLQVLSSGKEVVTDEFNKINRHEIYCNIRKIPVLDQDRITHIMTIIRDDTKLIRSQNLIQIQRDIVTALSSNGTSDIALNKMMQRMTQINEIDSWGVFMLDPVSLEMTLLSSQRLSKNLLKELLSVFKHPQPDKAFPDKPAYYEYPIDLLTLEKRYLTSNLHSLSIFPISDGQKPLAYFVIGSHVFDTVSKTTRNILETIISQIGKVILRIRSEREKRESEAKYQLLFDRVLDAVLLIDAQTGMIVDANQSAVLLYGYSKQELINRHITEVSGEIDKTEDAIRSCVEMGLIKIPLRWLKKKDDTLFPAEITSGTFVWRGRKVICSIIRDHTVRRQLEEELLNSKKREAIGILAGGIAHDYNNFINIIMGYINLAQLQLDPGHTVHQKLCEAEKACICAKDLTQKFVSFSMPSYNKSIVEDLDYTIQVIANNRIKQPFCNYHLEIADKLWPASVDPDQFHKIMGEIIDNAVEASPVGGNIRIYAQNIEVDDQHIKPMLSIKTGRYIEIAVQDNGCGISRDNLSRIFDPYFSTKQRGAKKGTGLGLAIAYAVIKQCNGHIQVKSHQGKGTTLTVYLPAVV